MQNEMNEDHEIRLFVLNRGHTHTQTFFESLPPHQIYSQVITAHGHVESHPLSVEITHPPSVKNTLVKCLT